jgi:dihydrofolate reductase
MRKIVLLLAVSLDGFIEGPNGEYDWCLTDQDYGLSTFFKRIDSLFIGRKTYELMLTMPDQGVNGFPKLKEYIFSQTLDRVKDGAILIRDDVKSQIEKIRKEKGKDIWLFGGAALTSSLMNLGLVDEISLAVHPILLGTGKPLFTDIASIIHLKLMDTKTYASGLVTLNYQVVGSDA